MAHGCFGFAHTGEDNFVGTLVQLVRIHACHAWGHGFESRTHHCYELLEIVIHEFYRKEYISFNELKGEFIDAFEMHLRIVRKLSQNTLTKYMSCFRKIMYQDELLLMWKYIKNHAVNVLI